MKYMLSAALLGTLAACGATGQSGELRVRPVGQDVSYAEAPDERFDAAKLHIARGNNALAIEILRRLKRDRPDDVRVMNALGVAYDRIGRYDISRGFYEKAMGIDPTADYVAHNFGYSLGLQGKHGEARELLARAAQSPDPEVHAKAVALATYGGVSVAGVDYKPALVPTGRVLRTTAHTQTLTWMAAAASPAEQPIDLDTSAALLAVSDDRAVAGSLVRGGGARPEWEQLAIAALTAPRGERPVKPQHTIAFDDVVARFTSREIAQLRSTRTDAL